MPGKQLLFKSEAREKLLRGASVLTDAVRVTLGPRTKCVLIQKKFGRPLVCNDGVTIAKEVELPDPEENLGAQMIREAAEKRFISSFGGIMNQGEMESGDGFHPEGMPAISRGLRGAIPPE